jgi:hypothetical protein
VPVLVIQSSINPEARAYLRALVMRNQHALNVSLITPTFPWSEGIEPASGWDRKTWDFFYVFSLDAFDKILYLDYTRLVQHNLDTLFTAWPAPAGPRGRCLPCDDYEGISAGLFLLRPDYERYYRFGIYELMAKHPLDTKGRIMDWETVRTNHSLRVSSFIFIFIHPYSSIFIQFHHSFFSFIFIIFIIILVNLSKKIYN